MLYNSISHTDGEDAVESQIILLTSQSPATQSWLRAESDHFDYLIDGEDAVWSGWSNNKEDAT